MSTRRFTSLVVIALLMVACLALAVVLWQRLAHPQRPGPSAAPSPWPTAALASAGGETAMPPLAKPSADSQATPALGTPSAAAAAPETPVSPTPNLPSVLTPGPAVSTVAPGGMATAPTVAPLLSEPSAAAVAGSLSIPSLGLVVPIASVSWSLVEVEGLPLAQWDTLPAAVGHHLGSAPLGGPGNCVLSGHSNPDVGGLLQGLDALRKGDALIVTDATGRLTTYHIAEIVQVRELGASLDERRANARYMAPTDDTRLTLITCWPAWAYTHRLILVARPAP